MSATHSARYFLAHRTSAFLNYLHVDLTIAGMALVFVLAGGLANNLKLFRPIASALPDFSLAVEAPAPLPAARRPAKHLVPAMAAALDQVAQRYRVSPEALQPVFEAAQAAGRQWRVDPLLIVAVISIESKFNPFSHSSMGAQGLMQIIPRYHQDKLPRDAGNLALYDPVTNVQVGTRILQESIYRQGGLIEGLQYYGGAVDDVEQAYANKVLAERNRLEQAPRRNKDGSNV